MAMSQVVELNENDIVSVGKGLHLLQKLEFILDSRFFKIYLSKIGLLEYYSFSTQFKILLFWVSLSISRIHMEMFMYRWSEKTTYARTSIWTACPKDIFIYKLYYKCEEDLPNMRWSSLFVSQVIGIFIRK